MVEHTDTPYNVATFPTPHTYTNQDSAVLSQNTSTTTRITSSNETETPNQLMNNKSNGATATTTTTASSTSTSEDESDGVATINLDIIGDINHNDSCEDLTQCDYDVHVGSAPLLPGVVSTLKSSCERLLLNGNSVDTSTETLVAENATIGASPLNSSTQPTPTNNHRDETDSRTVNYSCQSQNVSVINNRQCHPTVTNSKQTCSVCAQNKRFVAESHFNPLQNNHPLHHHTTDDSSIQTNTAGINNLPSNSSRTMQAAQQQYCVNSANSQQSNGQCSIDGGNTNNFSLNGYYGSGSSNVTSGVNTPTSLMTDDSVTAAMSVMESPALNSMTISGYWGAPSAKMAPNKAASLGDDGLVPLRLEMQERVATLIQENGREIERLKHEVHKYRYALLQQLCHRCHHNDNDKYDDAPTTSTHTTSPSSFPTSTCHCPTTNNPNAANNGGPYPSSSTGYFDGRNMSGHMSAAHESATVASSLRSDHSWDNVDDMLVLEQQQQQQGALGNPTLWMPDHAVSRCADCRVEFWIGRRRHHCRKCGQIFCAECSEHYAPIPMEHLYTPVRVCRGCFTTLRQSNTALLDDEDLIGRQSSEIGDGSNALLNGAMETVEAINGVTTPSNMILPNHNYTPRNASEISHVVHTSSHKPSHNMPPQPVQCCHHQHQQQQAASLSATTSAGGCVTSSGGACNAASSQIAASSN